MVCVSVGACVCGVCTQMCTHEEARRSALLYHSLLYSLRQSLLLSPSLGLQPVDGSSAPFATPHSTTGFSHQFRGLTLRVSGLSGYCPHHWVVSPSPGHCPSWGSLSHKHMAGDVTTGTQASCLLLSGRISRWKRERIEHQPFLLQQYLPWGQASWALSLREEAVIYFFNFFLGIILDVEGSCRNVQIIHVSPTPSLSPIIVCYVTTEIVKTRKLAG